MEIKQQIEMILCKDDSSKIESFYFRINKLSEGKFVSKTNSAFMCNIDRDLEGNILGIEVLV
jgi:hypothetical protein